MSRQLSTVAALLSLALSASVTQADIVLLSASRGAGASGTVGDDIQSVSDGSGDSTNAFGSFVFANGVGVNEPQGSVNGFARQNSQLESNAITMSGSADINVSAGPGEFDFGSGSAYSSLDVTFQVDGPTQLDIAYSGGGFPAYVEPFFVLQQIGGPIVASYYNGSVQESISLSSGQYVLSAGISAGSSAYEPGASGSGQGALSFNIAVVDVPGVCEDGIDNDGDGETDYPADPGCADAADLDEHAPTLPCDDGVDNDGDALTDFQPIVGDPGCRTPASLLENPKCDDDLDNDGDGGIDWDGGAAAATPDSRCVGSPWRNNEVASSCGLGAELALLLPGLVTLARRARSKSGSARHGQATLTS